MELFTMVITMCIGGGPCTTSHVSRPDFTSAAVCEEKIATVTHAKTKELAQDPTLKGKTVTYDVTCFSHAQFVATFGDPQSI
ncbi:MAG: hypothetical protein K2P80_00310 [Beijerinckiaceae bacterium]|nr:hypothetical protein [Beijerinckiaceae bacterium]